MQSDTKNGKHEIKFLIRRRIEKEMRGNVCVNLECKQKEWGKKEKFK